MSVSVPTEKSRSPPTTNKRIKDARSNILFFLKKEAISEFQSFIEEKYADTLLSRFWEVDENYIVEIYNPLVDKSVGFSEACKYYNIPQERTIAMGDGHNDIGLIKAAAISVAMGNSHPELLKYAKYQTTKNSEQGVLKFLKDFFEKK